MKRPIAISRAPLEKGSCRLAVGADTPVSLPREGLWAYRDLGSMPGQSRRVPHGG